MDLRRVFDCMISVSELGRGQASKVIQAVEDEGNPYIVVKNNKPQAVIVSINEYIELMRAKDFIENMRNAPTNIYHNFPPAKASSLTEDEISIFLQSEDNE